MARSPDAHGGRVSCLYRRWSAESAPLAGGASRVDLSAFGLMPPLAPPCRSPRCRSARARLRVMYSTRPHARRARHRRASLAQWGWYAARDHRRRAVLAARHAVGRAVLAHMTEHLVIADIGALVLGSPHGPRCSRRCYAPPGSAGCAARTPVPGVQPVGGRTCSSGISSGPHAPGAPRRRPCAAHMLFVGGDQHVDGALGPLPKPAWFATARSSATSSRCVHHDVLANIFVWTGVPSST